MRAERMALSRGAWVRAGAVAANQSGTALVLLSILLLLVATAMLLEPSRLKVAEGGARRAATARALAEAKAALVARAVTLHAARGKHVTPGLLPFPDRNRDGNYDGRGDCVTFGLNASHLLGRLPWAGEAPPCPRHALGLGARDAGGERLWYAVSRNLVAGGDGGPVNPDSAARGRMGHPWIVVRNADGSVVTEPRTGMPLPVAAVVIAPGPALGDQNRGGVAPAAENYLDRIGIDGVTYDNSDSDGCADIVRPPCAARSRGEEFIVRPGASDAGGFNDRLAYITVAELVSAVENRVLGEVAVALNRYRDAQGAYPWLVRPSDPGRSDFKSNLSRQGLLAVHLPEEIFSTSFAATWHLEDATPTSATRYSGNAALTPSLDDVRAGHIQVTRVSGRCLWSEPIRAECTGVHIDGDFFRADLGISVKRVIEISFSVVDRAPEVTPPASADVRRRSLSMSGAPLPRMASSRPAAPWNVRVTDEHGVDWGRRDIHIDSNTAGTVALGGIRFELSIVYDDVHDGRDELPEWFAENDWHHFIYVAVSADAVPGGDVDGDGNCATPVDTCLRLKVAGTVARSDIRALAVSSGPPLPHQDRARGKCGSGRVHGFRCALLEGDNADQSTPLAADTFARDRRAAGFNDQLRVIAPPPP